MNWWLAILGALLALLGFVSGVLVNEWCAYPKWQGGGRVRSAEVARIKRELEEKYGKRKTNGRAFQT